MVLPLCSVCAQGAFLCPRCQGKLDSGSISEYDVEASRVLYELFGSDADFIRAIDTGNNVILIVKAEDVGKVIGRGGSNLRVISKRLGRDVKVVGDGSFKEMAEAFIAPAKIQGINNVYQPDGGVKIRVRVAEEDRKHLRMDPDSLRKLMAAVTEEKVELAFD